MSEDAGILFCAVLPPVWTIGYGHTLGVKEGQRITQAQADGLLVEDIRKYEKKVNKYYDRYAWRQNEFDALVSFAFNVGSIDQLSANLPHSFFSSQFIYPVHPAGLDPLLVTVTFCGLFRENRVKKWELSSMRILQKRSLKS